MIRNFRIEVPPTQYFIYEFKLWFRYSISDTEALLYYGRRCASFDPVGGTRLLHLCICLLPRQISSARLIAISARATHHETNHPVRACSHRGFERRNAARV